MKKIYKQRLTGGALVALAVALTLVIASCVGRTNLRIPVRPNATDTTGVIIGSPTGLMPKVIKVVCITNGCHLGTAVGSDTASAPDGPSKVLVSYRTPVDVPAGTVISLEIQLSKATADQ